VHLQKLTQAFHNIAPSRRAQARANAPNGVDDDIVEASAARSKAVVRKAQTSPWALRLPNELLLNILRQSKDPAAYASMRHTCKAWNEKLTYDGMIGDTLGAYRPLLPVPTALGEQIRQFHGLANSQRAFVAGRHRVSKLGPTLFFGRALAQTRDFVLFGSGSQLTLWDASRNQRVRTWDHADARQRYHQIPCPTAAALSANGQRVIVRDDYHWTTFYRFDGNHPPRVHAQTGFAMVVSADGAVGAFASGARGDIVNLWNLESGTTESLISPTQVKLLSLSNDGQRLAVGGDGGLFLWNLPNNRPVALRDFGVTSAMAFSPNGRWLASDDSYSTTLWDLQHDTADSVTSGGRELGPANHLVFSEDSSMFARSDDLRVEVRTGLGAADERTHDLEVDSGFEPAHLDFAPAGAARLVVGAERLHLFEMQPDGEFKTVGGTQGIKFKSTDGFQFTRDGRSITSGGSKPKRLTFR
jgi:hypothetical protein